MNISEIARQAGVSRTAVSRYFNDGYISEEKRDAIRKTVEETGYRPSVQAQTLRTKKTKMIGVIAPKIASSSVGRVVEGILSIVNESNYHMLLAVTQNDPKKELEYLEAFNEKQVDGVIFSATVFTAEHKRLLKALSVPVVIVGQQLSGYWCIFHDDYHASYDVTKLFLERGRKKLGFIGVLRQDKAAGAERYRGFQDAVRDMGYENLSENHVTGTFSVAAGYKKAEELLRKCGELDGIICATDMLAVGAVQYLNERGITVPGQILVAGQGDNEMAKVAVPSLITVHHSYERSGELAVLMLMELMEKRDADPQEVRLGYHIVEMGDEDRSS